jgi:LAO/AO transport system kinase
LSDEGAGVSLHDLIDSVARGDRRSLSRLITDLIERPNQATFSELAGRRHRRHITGITGPPGSGKSTLVDRLIGHHRSIDERPGVILIDPSSPFTGGALLGDRVRMQGHSGDSGVFMRSLATRGQLGGLAMGADAVAMALDIAGFDPLFIETVGVGQSELDVIKIANTVVVVLHPGWGDAVQANKAGLMEAGNVFVVNKADQPGADRIFGEIQEMLSMNSDADWLPPVVMTSALKGDGIADLVGAIAEHRSHLARIRD